MASNAVGERFDGGSFTAETVDLCPWRLIGQPIWKGRKGKGMGQELSEFRQQAKGLNEERNYIPLFSLFFWVQADS